MKEIQMEPEILRRKEFASSQHFSLQLMTMTEWGWDVKVSSNIDRELQVLDGPAAAKLRGLSVGKKTCSQ